MLEGAAEEPAAAEHQADHEAGEAADHQPHADLAGGHAEMPVELVLDEHRGKRAHDDEQRGDHVAEQEAGRRDRLPHDEDRRDDRDAQERHAAHAGKLQRRMRQLTGLSHRSARSMNMKNMTLTRITKQIAA